MNDSTGTECARCAGQNGFHDPVCAELKPKLAETPAEAQRMAIAGRSWPALKEGKTFDTERLAESPLFERRLF